MIHFALSYLSPFIRPKAARFETSGFLKGLKDIIKQETPGLIFPFTLQNKLLLVILSLLQKKLLFVRDVNPCFGWLRADFTGFSGNLFPFLINDFEMSFRLLGKIIEIFFFRYV